MPSFLALPRRVLFERLELLEPRNRLLDRLEVGERAAEPPVAHVRHAAARGFVAYGMLRGALGSHKQDGSALRGHRAHEVAGFPVERNGLLQVDNVKLVAFAIDERRHFRVPVPCPVSEMHARIQHVTHGDIRQSSAP